MDPESPGRVEPGEAIQEEEAKGKKAAKKGKKHTQALMSNPMYGDGED